MRTFDTYREAISEIRRDISKAPVVTSGRVQQHRIAGRVHEATNYGYTILRGGMPVSRKEFLAETQRAFPFWQKHGDAIAQWLQAEERARYSLWLLETAHEESLPDLLHPEISTLREGNTFAYTYQDRLVGARDALLAALVSDLHTRRAYWPIFIPEDAVRARRLSRIPCSLGYHIMVRPVPGLGELLELTYLQRSCDFDRFWASDIWLAYALQQRLIQQWNYMYGETQPLRAGSLSHFVLSLHAFIDDEVY